MGNFTVELKPTQCAICLDDACDREIYPANFQPQDLSPEVFSARRQPDKIHYRMVACRKCGLMRSNPILSKESLGHLYTQSHFTYPQEALWAAQTYRSYFMRYLGNVPKEACILEIGCGNGTFLNELYQKGYQNLCGVEPSVQAINESGLMKSFIHQGMFVQGIYPEQHFDVIAAFQVFDHISQPNEFLRACWVSLKPGGKLLLIMHDIGSLLACILGRNCPMIDIEHAFLYNKTTLKALLTARGFNTTEIFSVGNRYPLKYWTKIMPAPSGFKKRVLGFLQKHSIGQVSLRFNVGNMGLIAVKAQQ